MAARTYHDGSYGQRAVYGQVKVPPLPVFHEHKPVKPVSSRRCRGPSGVGLLLLAGGTLFICALLVLLNTISEGPAAPRILKETQLVRAEERFAAPQAAAHKAIIDEWKNKKLTSEQEQIRAQGYQRNAFNQMISDLLPLDREFGDHRPDECLAQWYLPPSELPTTSVIIIFHNEAISTLLRTVHSVLNRSPSALIAEVLLVDDASTGEWLDASFEAQVAAIPKARLMRLPERSGLIRAKIAGARQARGEVILFLDSHCEVNPGWLQPMLHRLREEPNAIVCPVIDIIKSDDFSYVPVSATTQIGVFTWFMQFSWSELTEQQQAARPSSVAPIPSPTMAGGLFAMRKILETYLIVLNSASNCVVAHFQSTSFSTAPVSSAFLIIATCGRNPSSGECLVLTTTNYDSVRDVKMRCLVPESSTATKIVLDNCNENGRFALDLGWLEWKHLQTGQVYHPATNRCIGMIANNGTSNSEVGLVSCSKSAKQQWTFTEFSDIEYSS
ncbi:uncharacterized protein MONBRDRAFT_32151 [Monosiga brevicollis MX1]|uniref:Glycosyltransferase 2-like domain-containing protein n=1 Tax=Monosiga brevicollis TaxID=81824 RepID=A9UXZ4_MONBE|nr:uncharacterized protein MONBRDRAFT_32151 [Monosiga brevicollis MX1]EDQ89771.1 predicted protein [Monosiga brevicollis MX1]|eukprot:XP_001745193.1 hypothetical protein [Monosiga brevicollis MX1]